MDLNYSAGPFLAVLFLAHPVFLVESSLAWPISLCYIPAGFQFSKKMTPDPTLCSKLISYEASEVIYSSSNVLVSETEVF